MLPLYSVNDHPTDEHVSVLMEALCICWPSTQAYQRLCWEDELFLHQVILDSINGDLNKTYAVHLPGLLLRMITKTRNTRLARLRQSTKASGLKAKG